jgi:hypothetical protein
MGYARFIPASTAPSSEEEAAALFVSKAVPDNAAGTVRTLTGANATVTSPVMPFFAPTSVTATLADDIGLGATKNPGATITYTAIINNAGGPSEDATGTIFTANLDPNTTLVGSSLNAQPIAKADSYSGTGNIPISIAAPGVLTNDVDPMTGTNAGLTVTEVQGAAGNVGVATDTTAVGANLVKGSVTLASTGNFTYEPPPGYVGTDTFTYKTSEGTLTDTNTVTITITNMAWFIKNTGVSSNRGTFSNPFTSIASFNTANALADAAPNPKSGDTIALRTGTYAEGDGVNLRGSQKLIGEAIQFNTVFTADSNSSSAYTTFAGATNTAPTISTSAGNGIDLASGNTVRGLNVGNTPGFFGFNGGVVASPVINTVAKTGTGGAINITTSGAFSTNVTFSTLESSSSPGANINLVGVTGTLGITSSGAGLTGSAASSNAINISGGSVDFTYPGGVTKASLGALLNVSGGHTGTLTFNTGTLSATAGTGLQFDNADGTYNFNGTTTLNGGDAGVDILNGSAATFFFSTNTSITNPASASPAPAGVGFYISGSNAAGSYNGSISDNTGFAIDIDNHDAGTFTFGTGSITSTAQGLRVANSNGGTINFDGPTKNLNTGANQAVTLDTNNSGGTVNFGNGGLNIDTTTAKGFSAAGGGTVTVTTGTNANTIDSTTGTALNVDNTTIGAGGMTFQSISSNGAPSGIILNNTVTGGLTVAGNGGTCSSAATCTGGAIQNSSGPGISLTNVTGGASFNRIAVTGGGDDGIRATNVGANTPAIGILLANSRVSGNGNAVNENGLEYSNVKGISSIQSSTITGSGEFNARFASDNGIADLTVSSSTFSSNSTTTGADGLLIYTDAVANTAKIRALIQNSTFQANRDDGFQLLAGGDSSVDLTFNNNTVIAAGNAGSGSAQSAINFDSNTTSDVRIAMTGGNVSSAQPGLGGSAIIINPIGNSSSPGAAISSTFDATLDNVTVGTAGVPGSGSATGFGIWAKPTENTAAKIVIKNSHINGTAQFGIELRHNDGGGTSDFTVTGNTIRNVGSGNEPIFVQSGSLNTDANTVCADIGGTGGDNTNPPGNDFAGQASGGVTDISFRRPSAAASAHLKLPGFSPPASTNLQPYIQGRNLGNPTALNFSGELEAGPAACQQPTSPTLPTTAPVLAMADPQLDSVSIPSQDSAAVSGHDFAAPQSKNITQLPLVSATNLATNANDSQAIATAAWSSTRDTSSVPRLESIYRLPVTANAASSVTLKTASAPQAGRKSDEVRLNHARRTSLAKRSAAADDKPLTPLSGETVTVDGSGGTGFTLPGGDSVTITFQATVNTPLGARSVSVQGKVSGTNFALVNGITTANPNTNDPETAAVNDATVTNINTVSTWTGATSTDWNTITNWNPNTYAPGVTNPAVNDVIIPNVGNQPTIGAAMGDVGVYSLNISNGRTLTIDPTRILTIGGSPGGDLTLDGIISGGQLRFGTGTHAFNNAGGTGNLSPANQLFVISGSTVTLNHNLQAGLLAVSAGGSMNITSKTLSLNGSGAALGVAGTFTTTTSTIVLNGAAAQTIAGTTYNNLTIANTLGAHVTGVTLIGNATVNGVLTLTSSDLATGANTLTMPVGATSAPATGATDVVGNVKRTGFVSGGSALSFGNPLNTIRINSGTAPTDINVLLAKNAPATYAAAVQRSYTITPNGGSSINATVRLHYRQAELNGNDDTSVPNFNFRRFTAGAWKAVVPTSRNTNVVEDNWLENNTVTTFSEWTFANLSPSAAAGTVSGVITTSDGTPVEGTVVRLSGDQTRKTITDSKGRYSFDNVDVNGFYTVTPSRVNYHFNPFNRAFTQLGNQTDAAFAASFTGDNANPLDTPEYFVRQQYVDLLGREPDEGGFNYWSDRLLECGSDADCMSQRRSDIAAAFFIEQEFQQTGSFIDALYKGSLGRRPGYSEYSADRKLVIGGPDLETEKAAFAADFVKRPEFLQKYQSTTTGESFVDALLANVWQTSNLDLGTQRGVLLALYQTGGDMNQSRALVLRQLGENPSLKGVEYNPAFVLTEYFGYLRRNPEAEGYNFWLNVLDNREPGNFRGMVCSFITSTEYQKRFSSVVSHSNADCGR